MGFSGWLDRLAGLQRDGIVLIWYVLRIILSSNLRREKCWELGSHVTTQYFNIPNTSLILEMNSL